MYNFRCHRGGFAESMQTKVQFDELYKVFDFCSSEYNCLVSNIYIQYYSFDFRLGTECYLVCYMANNFLYPIGFLWEERA